MKLTHSLGNYNLESGGYTVDILLVSYTMPRTSSVLDSFHLMTAAHIFKESIRIMLLHPTHFHSISVFLFHPFSISLFLSRYLIQRFPHLPSSAANISSHLLGQSELLPLPKLLSRIGLQVVICFPSSITLLLLGLAASVQAVSDSYNGRNLDSRRLLMKSGLAWMKLLHTTFWECLILLGLLVLLLSSLAAVHGMLFAYGLGSRIVVFWGVLAFLGVPFCLAFANLMVVGNVAKVLAVLETECSGLESLIKANNIVAGKRRTALGLALMSNMGFRLVECLFEFRIRKGVRLWEIPFFVSMYSLVLVSETVMNVVFYFACKP